MFEISIFCVIALAIGYWVALWLMGRHDDVLHGDFVRPERGSDQALGTQSRPSPSMPFSSAPLSSAGLPSVPLRSTAGPLPSGMAPRPNADSLEALLAAIKRDLKDATQI
jgi:hypothetical protein